MVKRIKSTLSVMGRTICVFLLPSLSFAQAVSLSSNSNLDFGFIEFSSIHQGELTVGTNGGAMLTGTGLYYQGGAVPAQISINGTTGVVEIKCDDSITLGTAGGSSLEVTDIDASANVGVSPGAGSPCNGGDISNTTALLVDLDSTPNPVVFFGGKLNMPMGSLDGINTFQSNSGSGTTLTINAVFQ